MAFSNFEFKDYQCYIRIYISLSIYIGAFHLVRTHLGGVGGFKSPIHFHCVLHAKGGGGVQKACKIA